MQEPFRIEAKTMDMFIYVVLIINLIMKDDDRKDQTLLHLVIETVKPYRESTLLIA